MSHTAPSVDILLITYNHSGYVARAIESIAYQDYPGPRRLIVADDCSTDDTLAIIKETARKHDISIKILLTQNNLGITKNYQRAFSACNADFVAVLEGDDYWSSTKKLSKQIAFLQEHRECVACSCNYYIADEERCDFTLRVDRADGYLLLTPRSLIHDNTIGNFSTCIYRRSALDKIPTRLYDLKSYDWIVNICISREGPVGFLNEPLSVYRQHSNGVWSSAKLKDKLIEQLSLIPDYNELTNKVFNQEFEQLETRLLSLPELKSERRKAKSVAIHRKAARELGKLMPPILPLFARAILPPPIYRAFSRRA